MSRASGPEAIRTGKEVLLIHRLQHHDDCSLRQLIFEGRDAERPTRAIRLRNVCPTHWRRYVTTRLDAIQKVQEIGLQVCRIVVRHHTQLRGGLRVAPLSSVPPAKTNRLLPWSSARSRDGRRSSR